MIDNDNILKGITVYGGAAPGNNPAYAEAAEVLGREIARRGLPLIYGGGFLGMMGAVSAAARNAGGSVRAIIPRFMVERGWSDPDATETIVTADIHQRKRLMAAQSVGAVALPGGVGTFEELAEIITWRQLGLYSHPVVILNVAGYYDGFLAQISSAVEAGFLKNAPSDLFLVTDDPACALTYIIESGYSRT